ncbi:hypothetical protein [Komagataeibacter swingsii]|uniref:Uncharacterized protein n=1 Tax=Komagataeibacter swingsii TaxID=215220 RepID=A0A850P482_9PROT|nr:hypothetical protein [Komagataeibacter swingsii]NVN37893.1 hypothetical protein [Komagataeibacter swingsii]
MPPGNMAIPENSTKAGHTRRQAGQMVAACRQIHYPAIRATVTSSPVLSGYGFIVYIIMYIFIFYSFSLPCFLLFIFRHIVLCIAKWTAKL